MNEPDGSELLAVRKELERALEVLETVNEQLLEMNATAGAVARSVVAALQAIQKGAMGDWQAAARDLDRIQFELIQIYGRSQPSRWSVVGRVATRGSRSGKNGSPLLPRTPGVVDLRTRGGDSQP